MRVLSWYGSRNDFSKFADRTLDIWFGDVSEQPIKLLRQGPELKYATNKKLIILDYDDVVNEYQTPAPASLLVLNLIENNSYLEEHKERFLYNFKMLESAEDPRPYADAISHDFRKGELTYKLYIKACEYAAENFSMVSGFTSAINSLREMAYRPFILTASPQELLESCQKRLTIGMRDIEASKFYFDSHGIFERMELNLDETRSIKRDKILEQSIFTRNGFEFMVDNNLVTGKRIVKPGFRFYIWAAKEVPVMYDNISIKMFELRTDFTKLPDKTKRIEKGISIPIVIDQSDYKRAIELGHTAKDHGDRALNLSGEDFKIEKFKFLEDLGLHINLMHYIFPSELTEIRRHMNDLRFEKKERLAKIKLKLVMELFLENSLEPKMPLDLITS